jgi:hypothetical protein
MQVLDNYITNFAIRPDENARKEFLHFTFLTKNRI